MLNHYIENIEKYHATVGAIIRALVVHADISSFISPIIGF